MLVIKIELWPFGIERAKRVLHEGRIWNDGTGTDRIGHYEIRLMDRRGQVWKRGRVENFPRKRLLAWDLLYRALTSLIQKRNNLPGSGKIVRQAKAIGIEEIEGHDARSNGRGNRLRRVRHRAAVSPRDERAGANGKVRKCRLPSTDCHVSQLP